MWLQDFHEGLCYPALPSRRVGTTGYTPTSHTEKGNDAFSRIGAFNMGRLTQSNIFSSASITKSDNGSDQSIFGLQNARFLLSITKVSGTSPTLDVSIEGQTTSGNYVKLATFPRAKGIDSYSIDILRMPQHFRVSWVIEGAAPDFTFEIDAILEIGL